MRMRFDELQDRKSRRGLNQPLTRLLYNSGRESRKGLERKRLACNERAARTVVIASASCPSTPCTCLRRSEWQSFGRRKFCTSQASLIVALPDRRSDHSRFPASRERANRRDSCESL